MGFLTVKGKLMTFSEYEHLLEAYKERGLLEFLEIYQAHKGKHRERRDLHWGEEMEYTLFHFDEKRGRVQLTNSAFDLIHEFNEEHGGEEIDLHPEFGNWMVEAVPSRPYGAYEDLEDLLTCFAKIKRR
jgi:hypothetical protein